MAGPVRAALAVVLLAVLAGRGEALIVKTWDGVGTPDLINTTPPADDPGWANLPDNKTGVYIGGGLFVTAAHAEGVNPGSLIEIGGGQFPVIPGSVKRLTNPSQFGARTPDSTSDIWVYRVGVDVSSGLSPEELDPSIRQISIADRLPNTSTAVQEQVVMIGLGSNRLINTANETNGQWYFNSSGSVISDPDDWDSASYVGFRYSSVPSASTRQWQWGENRRTTARSGGIYKFQNNVLIADVVNDTIGFQTRFDASDRDDEAQAAGGDSGGPVFWKDGDEWVLAGVMHAVSAPSNALLGAFGSAYTSISDLSYPHYRDQIEDARTRYSLLGDIDLDGQVTGSIVNGEATGDLGILIDHWQETSSGDDIHSWMNGDLNLDGITNLQDYALLRDALGGSIPESDLALLISSLSIPEPAAATLAIACLLAGGFARRR